MGLKSGDLLITEMSRDSGSDKANQGSFDKTTFRRAKPEGG